jgi:uroporphyrinogen-III decarboxylase
LRRQLDPDDSERLPGNWRERVESWRQRQHALALPIHRGFFLTMGVEGWNRFEEVLYLAKDDPVLVTDIMRAHGEFAARLADRVLGEVEVDCLLFSEPIGGSDRPLLSPAAYGDLVLSSYRPIIEVARRRGVATVVLATYGNTRVLLPDLIEAGFNCLWAMEVENEDMDYLALRERFGRQLRLIGGIDLDVLYRDEESIEAELERRLPQLLDQGGYAPLVDGRVRANVPFASYTCYRRTLERLTT